MSVINKNDYFSNKKFQELTGDRINQLPEFQEAGFGQKYLRPMLSQYGFFQAEGLSQDFIKLAEKAKNKSKAFAESRKIEDVISINGRPLPGIFNGMRLRGGVYTSKFDKSRRQQKINNVKVSDSIRFFQTDDGIKPISGMVNYILLDDQYSSANAKMQEFLKIITDWKDGIIKAGFDRVFYMLSSFNGSRFTKGMNFSRVKINDYTFDIPVNSNEGQINASFAFEQFEILKVENKLKKPKTKEENEGAANTIMNDPGLPPTITNGFNTGIG